MLSQLWQGCRYRPPHRPDRHARITVIPVPKLTVKLEFKAPPALRASGKVGREASKCHVRHLERAKRLVRCPRQREHHYTAPEAMFLRSMPRARLLHISMPSMVIWSILVWLDGRKTRPRPMGGPGCGRGLGLLLFALQVIISCFPLSSLPVLFCIVRGPEAQSRPFPFPFLYK